ncbi:MAG TPA: flagellar basal body P-ring formation chaperone FlgA [Burkholderiaceae bacterium]
MLRLLCLLALSLAAAGAAQADPLDPALLARVQALAETGARAVMPPGARVEVRLGQLDARLRLAPCAEVQPYLPAGLALWGRSRIGLRCVDRQAGHARWNVSLPVTVRIFARALVAKQVLPTGTLLAAGQLEAAEVDIAEQAGSVYTDAAALLGRELARPLGAGETLRQQHLKVKQWFAAGAWVEVHGVGGGFTVSTEGQALAPGLEGQAVRVRVEGGRMLTGRAVGERRVDVEL